MNPRSGLDGAVMKEIILFHCGEEEDKNCFSPLAEDSMSLTLFFPQFNLHPCVAESESLLNVWFDTAACFTPSTSSEVLLESRCPEALAGLLDDAGIWDSTVHAQKVWETEDHTCITQNIVLTQVQPVQGARLVPAHSDIDAAIGTGVSKSLASYGIPPFRLWGTSAHATDTVATFHTAEV